MLNDGDDPAQARSNLDKRGPEWSHAAISACEKGQEYGRRPSQIENGRQPNKSDAISACEKGQEGDPSPPGPLSPTTGTTHTDPGTPNYPPHTKRERGGGATGKRKHSKPAVSGQTKRLNKNPRADSQLLTRGW